MIGCAVMIGCSAFIIGFVATQITNDPTNPPALLAGAFIGGCAFVAALLLANRDRRRRMFAARRVRHRLVQRNDVNDSEFLTHFPHVDFTLIIQTRNAISQFFSIPAQKIHPTDKLSIHLEFDVFEPVVHFFVVHHVLNARNIAPQPFTFSASGLTDIGDLAIKIQHLLDRNNPPV